MIVENLRILVGVKYKMDYNKILHEVHSLNKKERQIAEHCINEEEAIYAIKNYREYDDAYNYSMSLMEKDNYRNRFTPRNEKSKATSHILYDDMDD